MFNSRAIGWLTIESFFPLSSVRLVTLPGHVARQTYDINGNDDSEELRNHYYSIKCIQISKAA